MNRVTRVVQPLFRLAVVAGIAVFVGCVAPAAAGVNRWTSLELPLSCTAAAFDPHDPDRLYAGAFETILRSPDSGQTWSTVLTSTSRFFYNVLAFDPQVPGSVYATTGGPLFRSMDAGDTWTNVTPPIGRDVLSVAVHPTNSSTVYAGAVNGLFRSTDRGSTWTGVLAANVFNVVIAPQNPSVIYGYETSASYYYGNGPGRFYRSTDGGANWTNDLNPRGFSAGATAVDPVTASTLYAGTAGLLKSEDSGATWQLKGLDPDALVSGVVFDPRNANTMYASSFNGVFRSVDRGETWSDIGFGLNDRPITSLAIDPTGTRLLAVSYFGEVFAYQLYSGAWDLAAGAGQTTVAFVAPGSNSYLEDVDNVGGSIGSVDAFFNGAAVAAIAGGADLRWVLWNHEGGGTALQVVGSLQEHVFHRYHPVGQWTAADVSAGADRTATILWTNPDGRIGIWRVDSYGIVSSSLAFGPYPGWVARAIAQRADGKLTVLWTHTDGRVGISTIDGGHIVSSYRFTPEPGWTARDVTVATDGAARILMVGPDNEITLWSVDAEGTRTIGPRLGSPSEDQSAQRLSAGMDHLTRVLWTSPEGAGTIFLLRLDNTLQSSFELN